jgi:integrase
MRKLGEHYTGRELTGVTEREVFDYLIHRREVEKLRPSTLNQAVGCGCSSATTWAQWVLWERFQIRCNQPLPVVLTRQKTRRLLGSMRSGRFRAVLALIYHCGLRVGEAVALKPAHIDAERGVIRIVEGKGERMRECQSVSQCWSGSASIGPFTSTGDGFFPGVGRGWINV